MKTSLLILSVIVLAASGCKKEANRKALDAFFKYEANGKASIIKDEILLKDNTFEAYMVGDSLLYIHATKVYEGAGFILRTNKGQNNTYELNGYDKGFYENPVDKRIYYSSDKHKGTLTIKRGSFEGKTTIPTVEGEFSFVGVDASTGKIFEISKGQFLMEMKKNK
jgi:hypothetical protein